MSESVIAKRYAEALFQLSSEVELLDLFVTELTTVQEVFQENDELYAFLAHPRITNKQKKQLIDNSFGEFQVHIINTVKLLVDRNRVEIIPSMIDHFILKVHEVKSIAEATVYSVRELTGVETEHLQAQFAKRFDKQVVKIKNIVDPDILGGLRIRMGNTIYDGTLRNELNRIERNVVTANK